MITQRENEEDVVKDDKLYEEGHKYGTLEGDESWETVV